MNGLQASIDKMRRDDVGDAAVQAFADAYERLQEGETGVLAEADLEPVDEVPDAGELPGGDETAGGAIDHAVVIKLNGGLRPSQGMNRPQTPRRGQDGATV